MTILDLDGAYGTDVRPPRKPAGRKLWAKDPSIPGANDGTRLDATTINDLVGMFRQLMTAAGINPNAGDDSALANAIIAIIGLTAPASHSHEISALTDGGGFVRMTDAERAKLAALAANYKGSFADLAAVAGAYPTAAAGDWAVIMLVGEPASIAVWDTDTASWVDIDNAPPVTASQVPFTPAGSIEATNVQAALQELDAKKEPALGFTAVPTTRQVATAGLATGGGDLSASRTIAVPKAGASDLRGGSNDTNALTAKAAYDAAAEVVLTYADPLTISLTAGTNFALTLTGSPLINEPSGLTSVIGKMGRIRFIQGSTGNHEPSWGPAWEFPGGTPPTFSTAVGAEDIGYYDVLASGRIYLVLNKGVS